MKFLKKPVMIEAIQATGTPESNREIIDWTRGSSTPASMDKHPERGQCLTISTLEGAHWVTPGDWIIKGIKGEFYPCKPDIFEATYGPEIASEHYFTAAEGVDIADPEMTDAKMPEPLKRLTFCVFVLRNGFTVTGESACASPENFDAEIGRRLARENASNKVWSRLGFRLRDQISRSSQSA